ncbi:virulence factor TspB C-terminal domain-related protein [Paraburkholderia strydomiana]|uniref:virulence factor TspB C-terminal domain-related protein n=1 Tax=Paraburkholderia strydomiana TaxID=1245417 RepID=UPI0038BB5D13
MANLARRGITVAANDAVFADTMAFVGKAANDANYAATGASLVASVFGAPVWLSALIGVGALAAVGAVAWGAYQFSQSGTGSSAQLSLQNPNATPLPPPVASGSWTKYTSPMCNPQLTNTCGNYPALPSNVPFWTQGAPGTPTPTVIGCVSGLDCANQMAAAYAAFDGTVVTNLQVSVTPMYSGCQESSLGACAYKVLETWTPCATCDPTVTGREVDVWPGNNQNYASPGQTTGTLTSLQPTADMMNQPFPQQATAALADQLWKNAAAQPGYDGYPYDATNPVSQADIATSPVSPTWNDVLDSAPRPAGSTSVPIDVNPIPGTPYQPGTGVTNPSSGTAGATPPNTTDPCVIEPNASACAPLGAAPSAPPISTSSTNVSMSPWSVGALDGVCPAPKAVTVLGQEYSLSFDPLCALVQTLRPLVLALCALAAAFIVAMGVTT